MSLLEKDPPSIEDPTRKANSALENYTGSAFDEEELTGEERLGDDKEDNDQQLDWLTLARESYLFSTTYLDTNHRKRWEDSIRAFNSQHAQDSKYTSAAYAKRSNIYRPKLRSIERKNEAAAASAFFSNSDIVDIQAENQADPIERASAEVNKALLQYRLEKTVKWFQTLLGAFQDAQKVGACVARVYWEYEEDHRGRTKKDHPRVDLIPLENFRIDPAADWHDPVNTSPYVIHLMPMYVCDVREKMNRPDPKTGRPEWKSASDSLLRAAAQTMPDSTRIIREKNREDPYDTENRPVADYSVVWIQRHIHRRNGVDWEFYTLGDQCILTDPQPLEVSTWHGQRDYVLGCCILETHVSLPPSLHEIGKQLFEEINEVTNQRLDNVKFVLNKKWVVKRNKNVDTYGLTRNVPGGVVTADDPEGDIRELTWPDVTSSSFQEHDRLNSEADELMGNFNPANVQSMGKLSDTVHGAQMMTAPASLLTEYLLRTFVETWVLPVLRMMVKLEQHYETDEVILALAGQKAKIYQRYGINGVTDSLLNHELTIRVNVGMGATDPATKMMKFIAANNAYIAMVKAQVPGMNLQEVAKEIYGHAGYQDGTRFTTIDNPQVADLMQKLQQAMQFIQQLGKQLNDKTMEQQTKIEVAKINKEAKIESRPSGLDPMQAHVLKAHEVALKHEADVSRLEAELRKFVVEQMAKIGLKREEFALKHRELDVKSKSMNQKGKNSDRPGR
jgi:hypothetical protein